MKDAVAAQSARAKVRETQTVRDVVLDQLLRSKSTPPGAGHVRPSNVELLDSIEPPLRANRLGDRADAGTQDLLTRVSGGIVRGAHHDGRIRRMPHGRVVEIRRRADAGKINHVQPGGA